MPIIALTTDFGARDYYVAAMKGVILGLAPTATIVDVTHEIEPHNVQHGAVVIRQVWPWFPEETIYLAVVDPGVGTDRRILLAKYAGRYVIAPDNGLVTFLHREFAAEGMYLVENRRYFLGELSSTFHGRDILAPVAAHLANGVKPGEFGPLTDRVEFLNIAHQAERLGDRLVGCVLSVDRFGTLVTNVRQDQLAGLQWPQRAVEVLVNGTLIGPIRATFGDVPKGDPVAMIGSGGYLEIAVNQGRAVERFGSPAPVQIEIRVATGS